jgi:GNAT superfamily N-acetyltransferase
VGVRVVTPEDREIVLDIFVRSFYNDPMWSWIFTDPQTRPANQRVIWDLCLEGAARYPWTFLNDINTAASMWIPPGGSEFNEDQERRIGLAMAELLGDDVERVNANFAMFDKFHPRDIPHFYLSVLGTDPDHLGHHYGLTLLEENLAAIDDAGYPAYLEASHTGNVAVYQRYGFEPLGRFNAPQGGPTVTPMWRSARAIS